MIGRIKQRIISAVAMLTVVLALGGGPPLSGQSETAADPNRSSELYVIGPGDQLSIWALGVEELSEKPVRVDPYGFIDLPVLGRIKAAGITSVQLNSDLCTKLKKYVLEPKVAISVLEMQSQPVSVLGALNNPGVVQLKGEKNLLEVLSLAGGLKPEAGYSVRITRKREYGALPLRTNSDSGNFYTAEIDLKRLLEAKEPVLNIRIMPHDVVTVPRAELIYVMGEVKKPGGFVLGDRRTVSLLEALAKAEGLTGIAKASEAKILRVSDETPVRQEIALNIKRILDGKDGDVQLHADDILFVPGSGTKRASLRAVEAAIQLGTGVLIWR